MDAQADRDSQEPDQPGFDAHRRWKKLSAPMYDWMTNHHMTWPGLACRFGPSKRLDAAKYEQTVYFSDQVGQDNQGINKLIKQTIIVPEEGYSPMDHLNSWKENQRSPYFKKDRTVIHHPGDCNKIMDIQQVQDMVVTHGDCEDVFVWHFERQAQANAHNRHRKGKSIPDLRLTGHTQNAPFALSTSSASPSIASGGDDTNVLIWNLLDYSASAALGLDPSNAGAATRGQSTPGDILQQRHTLQGHEKTVTSVCFRPGNDEVLVSTADDRIIKVWDVREHKASCSFPQKAEEDLMCADWSACGNYVATGSGFGETHVYDARRFTASAPMGEVGNPVMTFNQYVRPQQAVLSVAWNPRKAAWLATAGDDGRVCIYDTSRPEAVTADRLPAQLVLQHIGHLGNIMDCQWSPHDDYTVMSVSNDSETYKDGGALQLWRLSFLLHQPAQEAMEVLKDHQTWLESGKIQDIPRNIPPTTAPKEAPRADAAPAAPIATTSGTAGGAAAATPGVAPVATPAATDVAMAAAAPAAAGAAPGAAAPTAAAAPATAAAPPSPADAAPAAAAASGGDVVMASTDGGAGGGPEESAATAVAAPGAVTTDAEGNVAMQDT